jgi:hypothetical protein
MTRYAAFRTLTGSDELVEFPRLRTEDILVGFERRYGEIELFQLRSTLGALFDVLIYLAPKIRVELVLQIEEEPLFGVL